ncbi:MAG: SUMF1/EgtB/PvdO family nonheme iron enzyme [Verrucomicrobia bacterium]|nr:SUMF1/EgtB/PvdO family nonheme iron enzyme [Verrucomicrobiota bacterium]
MPRVLPFFLALSFGVLSAETDDFVPIKGGILRPGIRLDDFEMLNRPVTNADYRAFVDDTGHPQPPYWTGGRIPAGLEQHPVVFVSRYNDVRAYTGWRSRQEGRVYRLPTSSEFEYAARAGRPEIKYPWGNEPPDGRANFSAQGERDISVWRQRLQPVKSHPPNPWGLHDMAGNVFQMVNEHPDVTLGGYVFRITSPDDREGWAMGGSWARTAYYLELGRSAYKLEGIRQADLGFRLVREPPGSTHFRRQLRRTVAASAGDRKVFLSWNLLPDDPPGVGFHVYRTQYRHAAGERLTAAPLADSTNFIDPNPPGARPTQHTRGEGPDQPDGELRSYYRVRAVLAGGGEGPPSEWAGLEPTEKRSGQIARFAPNVRSGGFTVALGDIDGDGVTDAVFRLDNGINERSADPGVPVELEAFTSWGKSIWRRPLVWHAQCYGSHNNSPVLLFDLDGDAKAEVVCRAQEGDLVYLAVLNGLTGETLRRTPWTPLVSDFSRSSTRIVLGIAYLDGKTPAIITQSGLYENEIFTAYDGNLKQLWQFKSFGETNGSGAHYIVNADVNGDGRDEVFDGTTCLNADGTVRWSIYAGHPDVVAVKRIIPGRPGRQVFFAVEDNTNAGAYVVDADTGAVLWKSNRENDPRWTHAHTGWVADIFADSPGMEMMTNRDGHLQRDTVLFDAQGKVIMNPWVGGWTPVNWLGGDRREMMSNNGKRLGFFNGATFEALPDPGPNEGEGRVMYAADLAGDFRDELICSVSENNRRSVVIYTNTTPIRKRDVTRLADREYRTWLARNLTAGYGSYFEWQPK